MANICIRVSIGVCQPDKKGREYKFSVGELNSKVDLTTWLDIIEDGMFKKITEKFGEIKECE